MSDVIERFDASGVYSPNGCFVRYEEFECLADRNKVLEESAKINRKIMDSYGPRFDEYDDEIERLTAERKRIVSQLHKLRDWLSDNSHAHQVTAMQVVNEILADMEPDECPACDDTGQKE